jgi:hypothetical protein
MSKPMRTTFCATVALRPIDAKRLEALAQQLVISKAEVLRQALKQLYESHAHDEKSA